jgi:hypothetical protein
MNTTQLAMIGLPVGLFCTMLAAMAVGQRMAVAGARRPNADVSTGVGAVDAAVLGLLGLLIAFWFNFAGERLQARRDLIVEEANAVGTAWLRLDLLPADAPPEDVRDLFRQYLDVRLAQHPGADRTESEESLATRLTTLRDAIWQRCVAASPRCASPQTAALLLDSLNAMFDAGTRHNAALNAHTPFAILMLLVLVAAFASVLAGHDMGDRRPFQWLHAVALAGVVSLTIWIIYDLEMPRYGLIRVDEFDQMLRDVRNDMTESAAAR